MGPDVSFPHVEGLQKKRKKKNKTETLTKS